jgi:hypothetical protein
MAEVRFASSASPPRCDPTGCGTAGRRWGPDVEAEAVVAGAHRTGLLADGLTHPSYEVRVPRRAEADRLREDGGRTHPRHTVQRLRSGAEGRVAQAVDRGRELVQGSRLFVEREPRQEVVDALRERQLRIAERCGVCGLCAATWDSLEMER